MVQRTSPLIVTPASARTARAETRSMVEVRGRITTPRTPPSPTSTFDPTHYKVDVSYNPLVVTDAGEFQRVKLLVANRGAAKQFDLAVQGDVSETGAHLFPGQATLQRSEAQEVFLDLAPAKTGTYTVHVLVTTDGRIRAYGHTMNDKELRARLKVESWTDRAGPGKPSNRSLHIRADRNVEFRFIEKILYYCTQEDIKIWKLSFGTAGLGTEAPEEEPRK